MGLKFGVQVGESAQHGDVPYPRVVRVNTLVAELTLLPEQAALVLVVGLWVEVFRQLIDRELVGVGSGTTGGVGRRRRW